MKVFSRKFFLILLPFVFAAITLIVYFVSKNNFKNSSASNVKDFSGLIRYDEKYGVFEGKKTKIPEIVFKPIEEKVLGAINSNKWIEVDLSDQKLKAWEGDSLYLESLVSTGLPWWPTPTGEFYIWVKLRATKMEGGSGKYYYNLPNVPYVMFFSNDKIPKWRGFGLHGTYWHNDFGNVHSHGCVNLPTEIAEKLYFWTDPVFGENKNSVYADEENSGTKIVIHD